jgi:ATP-binding cassette subfamily C protein
MNNYSFIGRTFNLLGKHKPWKLSLIFGLTLLLGVNSGFSIVLLIPLLQLLNIGGGEVANGPARFFSDLAGKAGIHLTLETILLIFVALLTLTAFLQYWKSILDARYQQTFIYDLRRRLFRKIILADWSLLNNKSKTNHLQVLTKEVPNMANYLFFYLRLLTTLIITASYIAFALAVSAKFTLLIIFVGALLFFLLRKFLFKSFHYGEGFVSSYNQLLKYIDDFWQTVKIAKVHSSEDFYYEKFDEASTSLLDLEFRMQKNWSVPQLIYRITGIVVLVIVVYFGYRFNQVSLASFFILILLFARIFPQFTGMNTDVNMILSNVASVKLVRQLDEDFPDTPFQQSIQLNTIPLQNEIRLENLEFAYPDGQLLFSNFSETIPANKITGIIGESGWGKTTLIDLIAGLQKPSMGTIRVDGHLLGDDLLPAWKNSIGYLPQDSFFIDGTLRENLVWDSREEVSDENILDVLEQVNAVHLVSRFDSGLDSFIVNYPFNFSGGECQRLALARVLLRKPRLLLLDEATSSLDAENEQTIMEVLTRLKERITIVFVTHRVSLLPWFDKVIKLGKHSFNSL